MRIIGLTGRAGAGKSSVTEVVKECFPSLQIISTGDATRRLLSGRNVEINHYNLQAITKEILAARGDDYISFVFEFFDSNYALVLIDSFRRVSDIRCVAKIFGTPIVIAVEAPEEIRFKRLLTRSRASDALDEKTFEDLKNLEKSWGVDDVCRIADYTLVNTGSREELRKQITNVFRLIISSK